MQTLGITVEKILQLSTWSETRLIGGQQGVKRIVKHVNIMEVPDILDWVKDGEFLLTTAFAIKDDLEAQNSLIPRLAAKGLAGLAIKPGRYIKEIPKLMIQQAEELNFPLIELPFDKAFSELMNPIYGEIFHYSHADFLDKSMATHELLMEIVLQGGGLDEIANSISSLIKNPVMIVNSFGEMLVAANWNYPYQHSWIFERKSGRFEIQEVNLKTKRFRLISFPITAGQKNYGYILILETTRFLEQIDLISIERASTIAALEIINQQAITEVERRYLNEYLYDLLHDRLENIEIMLSRARDLRLEPKKSYGVVVLYFVDESGKEMARQIIRRVEEGMKVIIGDWGSQLIILWPLFSQHKFRYLSQDTNFMQKLEFTNKYLEERDLHYYMGIGTSYQKFSQLAKSYQEASKAVKIARMMDKRNKFIFYENLGVYRLFENIQRAELEQYMSELFDSLIQYDQRHQTGLIETLKTYFEVDGNLKKVAKNLYLHYNTVLYRMERIQEITGIDLRDWDSRLGLEIALKIYLDFCLS